MAERTVTQLLQDRYGIEATPGGKAPCPTCGHESLSIKKDDRLAKCFHPGCGQAFTLGDEHGPSLSSVLAEMFHDWHQALLALKDAPYQSAYQYLTGWEEGERRVHPRVVEVARLGVVPTGGYDVRRAWEPLLEAVKAPSWRPSEAIKTGRRGRPTRERVEMARTERLEQLEGWRDTLMETLAGRSGWVILGYADRHHRLVSLKLRQPYTKHFVSWKPYKTIGGVFGAEVFAPTPEASARAWDAYLLVVEGEFNHLAVQSRQAWLAESHGKEPGYVNACAVGGVDSADIATVVALAPRPIVVYDHDASGAGWHLVERLRALTAVEAVTTPTVESDLDSFLKVFGHDHAAAWKAIQSLVQGRKRYGRVWSGTG